MSGFSRTMEEHVTKTIGALTVAGALALGATLSAQPGNPISQAVATEGHTNEGNMVSAAEAMPAEKYGYKPTEQQVSFGDLVYHAAVANYTLCSIVAGEKAPDTPVKATGAKPALIDQMKQSFAYCYKALDQLDTTTLGKQETLFGRSVTRAWVLSHLALDWGDHYSQAAMMLRLNGIVPPSAQRRPTSR